MEQELFEQFLVRDEAAISHISLKYGNYCRKVVGNILNNNADVEECLNDTWLKAWNLIPPNRPENMATYLGKLARNGAIDLKKRNYSKKRRWRWRGRN